MTFAVSSQGHVDAGLVHLLSDDRSDGVVGDAFLDPPDGGFAVLPFPQQAAVPSDWLATSRPMVSRAVWCHHRVRARGGGRGGGAMEAGIATQLITVGATLSGVVLTLVTNAQIEHRRARDVRELETLRLAAEHAKWLRDERLKGYGRLSIVSEEALQFIRSELPMLIGQGRERRDELEARWRELRTDLRKAYNQVALLGADEARTAARQLWRAARDGGNDLLRDIDAGPELSLERPDRSEQIRAVAAHMGTASNRLLEACRKDLQSNQELAPIGD